MPGGDRSSVGGVGARPREVMEAAREAGYAAVDALTALMILTTTIALALTATAQARRVAVAAQETQRAQAMLAYLFEAVDSQGARNGRMDGFAWRMDIAPMSSGGEGPSLCRRSLEVRALASRRAYTAMTVSPCPRATA